MKRIRNRFYATMSAAKHRRITRTLQRAYDALGEAVEHAEYFDGQVILEARYALTRVPGVLVVQVCSACAPSGYNDGGGDGYTSYGCSHPGVTALKIETGFKGKE